jgi:hypothetical protein
VNSAPHSNNPDGTVGLYLVSVISNCTYGTYPLPEFLPQTLPRGLHGGHHCRIPSQGCGGFSPAISPPNPTEVPMVPYENLFYPPLRDRLQQLAQRRAQELLSG